MPPKTRRQPTQGASSSSSKRTRKGKAPRAPSPPPPPLPYPLSTPNQLQRYKVLSKRAIIPSKFFDTFTMKKLGLEQEVNALLDRIGWIPFASMHIDTYTEITYEILSTIEAKYNPYDDTDPGIITFRCLGQDRELSLAELNFMFGFPNEGITRSVTSYVPNHAWHELTGRSEYNPSHSKASFLRSHALRYIHRVMSMSMFGRGDSTGVVNKIELMFLWAMTNNIKINTGVWLLKHLLHVSRCSKGKICVGGILSLIANAYGFIVQPNVHHPVDGSHLVDIETLLNMRMCRQIGRGRFRLLDATQNVLQQDDQDDDSDEDSEQEADSEEDQQPDVEVDMSGFPTAFPDHHQEAGPSGYVPGPSPTPQEPQMTQVMERLDRLELIQMQMMQMLQQNTEATNRIEEKLSQWK